MFESTYKRSHDSPIPRITLLNIAETSQKLSTVLNTFDKTSPHRSFSPNFFRNWTIPTKKPLKKPAPNRLKSKNLIPDPSSNTIDTYLTKVLAEFQIKNINFNEKKPYFKKKAKKNVFDKFFEENGAEEERRLVNYVKTCEIQY